MEQHAWQQAWRRLRWRRRGAWQWPAFALLTAVDAVVLALVPFYTDGPGGLYPSLLVAAFLNLVVVAVLAPLAARLVRRRRPDLPRIVARDYAGTALLGVLAAALLAGGLVHRPAAAASAAERRAVVAGVHAYVLSQEPALRGALAGIDVIELEPRYFRACVPRPEPQRWLCLFVSTDQRPAGLKRDPSETSNAAQQLGGG
jgi:MFS family permease